MNATARKAIRRLLAAARTMNKAVRFGTLNGAIGTLVANGDLVQASTHLRRLGLDDAEVRSFRSHFGKKVKAAYRESVGALPLTCWVLIDGHHRRVCVYLSYDRALTAGVTAYKRLATLVGTLPEAA